MKRINPQELRWAHQPKLYIMNADKLVLESEPKTHMRGTFGASDSAAAMERSVGKRFSFTVRMEYAFHGPLDECGIYLCNPNGNWCKFGVENLGSETVDLSCTIIKNGFADRSIREIGSAIRSLYLRIMVWDGTVRFQFSFSGEKFSELRVAELNSETNRTVGIYVCSPGNSYFDCTFSKMECSDL